MAGTTVVRERGFGFVRGDDGKEYFFHRSGVVGVGVFEDLSEDTPVTIEEEPGSPKGLRASHVLMRHGATANIPEGLG